MGVTLVYLSLIVPSPLATLVVKTAELSLGELWDLATSHRAIASYKVTFGASFAAALVHVVFGMLLA
jgi:sulfate transport system permease protein